MKYSKHNIQQINDFYFYSFCDFTITVLPFAFFPLLVPSTKRRSIARAAGWLADNLFSA